MSNKEPREGQAKSFWDAEREKLENWGKKPFPVQGKQEEPRWYDQDVVNMLNMAMDQISQSDFGRPEFISELIAHYKTKTS